MSRIVGLVIVGASGLLLLASQYMERFKTCSYDPTAGMTVCEPITIFSLGPIMLVGVLLVVPDFTEIGFAGIILKRQIESTKAKQKELTTELAKMSDIVELRTSIEQIQTQVDEAIADRPDTDVAPTEAKLEILADLQRVVDDLADATRDTGAPGSVIRRIEKFRTVADLARSYPDSVSSEELQALTGQARDLHGHLTDTSPKARPTDPRTIGGSG